MGSIYFETPCVLTTKATHGYSNERLLYTNLTAELSLSAQWTPAAASLVTQTPDCGTCSYKEKLASRADSS